MTSKMWEVMNDLEMVTSKIVSAREIIDAAIDRIQEHEYGKAETMMSAAYEFLEYYLGEFDEKFKLAWQETVVKQKKEEDGAWDAVNREKEYYEGWDYTATGEKFPRVCDKDDPSPECKKDWVDFWEETYYPEEHKKPTEPKVEDIMPPWGHSDMEALRYTEEELDAMCDAAAEKEERDKCREYNLREAEYYNKRAQLDAEYEAIKAAGGYEWTPIPSKDVPYPLYMNKEGEICSPDYVKKDKVKKWVLPVQQSYIDGVDDCFVYFPDDLLQAANLREGDIIEWVDQNDGSYLLKKVT